MSVPIAAPAGGVRIPRTDVLLLTGLPSSGKSTLARTLCAQLAAVGTPAEVLDGDELRERLPPRLGFSVAEREAQGERARFIAELLSSHGIMPIVALVAPFRRTRKAFRAAFGRRYLEVYLQAALHTCVARDTRHVYRLARERGDEDYRTIVGMYEPPRTPDLVLRTERADIRTCTRRLVACLHARSTAG